MLIRNLSLLIALPFLVFFLAGLTIVRGEEGDALTDMERGRNLRVNFLVQLLEFNLPQDSFALVNSTQDGKQIAVMQELSYSEAMTKFGTAARFSINGVQYTRAIEHWSWQSGRYRLLHFKDQNGTYKKVIVNTDLQRVLSSLESELCWGADDKMLYVAKGFTLSAVDPVTGDTRELMQEVSSFIKKSHRDEFFVFDPTGSITCRDGEGNVLEKGTSLNGVVTGSGYLGENIGVCCVRRNEKSTGHLVIISLGKLQSLCHSGDMSQCQFLKVVPLSKN